MPTRARTLANTVSTGGSLETPDAIPASDISGLSTVATSGSYNDLSNKPTTIATANDLSGGVTGAVPYQAGVGDTAMLSPGTSGQVLTSGGSGAAPSWAALPSGSEVIRVARTSNTALATSNRGNLIDITSGTFTQTFDAAATLGNGWFCYIRNSGTGDITLDPNGSETIDGLTSYVMYQYETRLVQCTGTAFITIVLSPFYRVFTTTGTFTKPPGYNSFGVIGWGGGGGGYGGMAPPGVGGGGGACVMAVVLASQLSSSTTMTIGSGGAGGLSGSGSADGGNSSIGSLITFYGGRRGLNGGGGGSGGALGPRASVNEGGEPWIQASNNPGYGGVDGTAANQKGYSAAWGGGGGSYGAGGDSIFGGGGGGGNNNSAAGTSIFGGNGGVGNGSNGSAPGGGGGSIYSNSFSAGSGGRGEIRIWGIV